jgi:hypothetical protein
MIKAVIVVLPVPPLPDIAMVFMVFQAVIEKKGSVPFFPAMIFFI